MGRSGRAPAIGKRSMCGHRHLRRKPLTKSPTEKRLTLNVQSARNSLSQWAINATTAGNLRKSRNNSEDTFSIVISVTCWRWKQSAANPSP